MNRSRVAPPPQQLHLSSSFNPLSSLPHLLLKTYHLRCLKAFLTTPLLLSSNLSLLSNPPSMVISTRWLLLLLPHLLLNKITQIEPLSTTSCRVSSPGTTWFLRVQLQEKSPIWTYSSMTFLPSWTLLSQVAYPLQPWTNVLLCCRPQSSRNKRVLCTFSKSILKVHPPRVVYWCLGNVKN